jgi:3',5'-cyclic-AMP phosphodiesterase
MCKIGRYKQLFISILFLLCSIVLSSTETVTAVSAAEKAYRHLVIIGDPHLPGNYLESKKKVLETINSWSDVDSVVAVGDLCEDRCTHEELSAVKVFFTGLKQPFLPIVGNHDYLYDDSLNAKGKRHKAGTDTREAKLLAFRELFGLKDNSYDKKVGNYLLIFISPDAPENLAALSQKQLEWLRSELDNNKKLATIIFFHAPLEGTVRNNNPNFTAQPSGRIHDLLREYPQVFLWVSGHTHTTPRDECFASEINVYEKRITNIHNSDMNRDTIWTNSLFLYPDKVVVKTFNHKKGVWLPEFDRSVVPPKLQ